MTNIDLTPSLRREIIIAQKNEITEHRIYIKLADIVKNQDNANLLRRIAQEEFHHYNFWKQFTDEEVHVIKWKVTFYFWLARILGLTFAIKLMEKGEENAQVSYSKLVSVIPAAQKIVDEEEEHEMELLNLIEEDKLKYIGSIVLGLNDALVELTGTLAGLTFALQNTRLTALAGLITGIAASLSMAASEYLSNKTDGNHEIAIRSATYTGIAYIFTVFLLVLPYFLVENYTVALIVTLTIAIFIIFIFNYYISVAKDLPFRKRFLEMAIISMGVALLSFGIGLLVRFMLGVDV